MAAHRRARGSTRRVPSDREWGREVGARPPLAPRTVLLAWAAGAVVLIALVVGVVGGPGPLDDPEPGRQRAGFLFDPDEAPIVGDLQLPGRPLDRRPVFLLFDRRGYDADRVDAVLEEVPRRFAFILVVPRAPAAEELPERVRALADRRRRIAAAVELGEPVDGGFPTGYALIDRERRVRYATLDPTYAEHAFEIHIVTDPIS